MLNIITAKVKEPEEIKPEIEALKTTATQAIPPEEIQGIIELIDNAILCKFPKLTREELSRMFGLTDLRQTRYYQDVFEEGKLEGKLEGKREGEIEGQLKGKLETIPGLLKLGLSAAQIAEAMELEISLVEKVIADLPTQDL